VTKHAFVLAMALVAGCSSTEPTANPTGTWNLTASYAGGSISCMIQATLALESTGTSIPGTLVENAVACTDGGTPIGVTPLSYTLQATVDGRRIVFTPQASVPVVGCAVLRYEGTVSAEAMSGMVGSMPLFCPGTFVPMEGSWSATLVAGP
jgi:hypothetical protein